MANGEKKPYDDSQAKKQSLDEKKIKDSQRETLKWEVAAELGLDGKIREMGWSGLTSAESGRIGGILANRRKKTKTE